MIVVWHFIHSWWWPESGEGYFWSSVAGSTALLFGWLPMTTLVGRKLLCQAPWCFRLGHHRTADGHHHLCRKHHPDLPNHRLSLKEIHIRHHHHAKALAGGPGPETSNLGG